PTATLVALALLGGHRLAAMHSEQDGEIHERERETHGEPAERDVGLTRGRDRAAFLQTNAPKSVSSRWPSAPTACPTGNCMKAFVATMKEPESQAPTSRATADAKCVRGEARPVRAELELHRHPRQDADGEVDAEDPDPEARRVVPALTA